VAQRPPGTPRPGELNTHDALPTGRAHRPAAIELEPNGVLRDEDAPSSPRAVAECRAMARERLDRAGDTEMGGVPQRRSVAGGFEAQRIAVGDAVAPVQLERDRVERQPVMNRAPPAADGGRQPVRKLMEQGEPLVDRIAPGPDRDDPDVTPGDPGRPDPPARAPGQARRPAASLGAHGLEERLRPGRGAHPADRRARSSLPASTIHASSSGSR